jgi:uncharacterized protein YkwD
MKLKIDWGYIFRIYASVFTVFAGIVLLVGVYYLGFVNGYNTGGKEALDQIVSSIEEVARVEEKEDDLPPARPPSEQEAPQGRRPSWSGPDLWEAVNERRVELGVNPLSTKSELCTIASIRLNQLLELGTLDGHEGFSDLPENREDLLWIFEKYNLTEFLVAGAESADEAVFLWENTLGHKKLLDGGEYVWGCIYAQEGFGVAITAF